VTKPLAGKIAALAGATCGAAWGIATVGKPRSAHRAAIVHRDIKPANILRTSNLNGLLR
jgi:serine/threonine protein kinase